MLSFTTSKQNKTRLALYTVVVIAQTAYNMVLILTPFVNDFLGTTGLQYSLSFSGYYIMVLLSSLCFGPISDRIGRRRAINISLLMYMIVHIIMYWTRNVNIYIVFRIVAGGFDTIQYLSQAVIADITNTRERPKYLAQLESMNNFAQTVGPLLAGVLSKYNLYLPLWVAVGLFCLALVISIVFLPESIPSVIEKKQLIATFELVEQQNQSKGVSLLDYEESKKIKEDFLANLHQQEMERLNNAKLRLNYLMIIAFIGEFCNRWTFSVFDTVVSIYGLQQYKMDALLFSMLSAIGSLANIFQTGWLFSFLIKKDFSIPIITSFAGVFGVIAMILCVCDSRVLFLLGSIFIIIAYGFASPTAPAIMSAESSDLSQGKAMSFTLIGGQSAYILAPLVLNNIYPYNNKMPFYISLLPNIVIFVMMIICNYLPGGRLAGQVSLADSLENDLEYKIADMEGSLEKKLGSGTERKTLQRFA